MKRLRWTTNTPTKPGWYWHQATMGDEIDREPEVLKIRLYVNRLAISNSTITDTWPGGEWAGPLPLPLPARKEKPRE